MDHYIDQLNSKKVDMKMEHEGKNMWLTRCEEACREIKSSYEGMLCN